ncbi:hypothetical protein [Pseudokineococcus sp. 1T1Z-3]|uniref:hypothetical protein n=1 Tax=Pseudokineococcus sp. 1T1Z-3 TaxID=3132745 RepID=UPI0030982F4A
MVIAVVLSALVAATVLSLLRPGALAVLVVAAAGVAWWLVNGPVEGAVLLVVTRTNGLTVADLLVPPLLAVAVAAAVVDRRSHDRGGRRRGVPLTRR